MNKRKYCIIVFNCVDDIELLEIVLRKNISKSTTGNAFEF
jgi:hypothetical protein